MSFHKKIAFIIVLLFGIGALAYCVFRLQILKEVPLSDQLFRQPSLGFVLVDHVSSTPKSVLYRFPDLKEQQLPGIWQHRFLNDSEIIVFGSDNNKEATQQVAIINTVQAAIKDISDLPGKIIDIEPSPNGTHLIISGIKNTTDEKSPEVGYTCVVKTSQKDYGACKTLFGDIIKDKTLSDDGEHVAVWNIFNSREYLTVHNTQDESKSISVDIASSTAVPITTSQEDETPAPGQVPMVEMVWPFAKITSRGETYYIVAPNKSSFIPLRADDDRLLMLDKQQVSLVNPKTKHVTKLFTLDAGEYRISTDAQRN